MARIDKGLIILVGRDRENPRTHRDAFQITGGLGEVLDKHIKRNNLNKSEFIREAIAAKLEAEMQNEPLIKDEKIRKAVRAWAEANDIDADEHLYVTSPTFDNKFLTIEKGGLVLSSYYDDESIKDGSYTITELCGEEAPEPLEPSFIDLDERIREKEEE